MMINPTCRRALGLAAAAGSTMFISSVATAQEVVYNNTSTPLGTLIGQVATGATTGYEAGDQVTLGGAGRTITSFEAYPYNLGAANSGTAQARFYDTTGANPGASTVLWDSGPVAMAFPAGQETLTFSVPNIVVPNTMVWTVTFTLTTPATNAFGARVYSPPTVGTSEDFFWAKDVPGAPGWTQRFFNGNPVANFGSKLIAQNVVVNGACCRTDGTCADLTNSACAAIAGAVFQGTGTACGTTTCPQPGACCLSGGACVSTVQTACTNQAGVFGGAGSTCASANCPHQYFYDDGTAENAIGFANNPGAGVGIANQFLSVAGADKITSISIVFGSPSGLNGLPITAYLWSDPNGDGSPADALVLESLPGTISGAVDTFPNNTPTFVTFDIPDHIIPVGQKFFVGFVMQNIPAPAYPGAYDANSPQHKSWIGFTAAGTPFDPNAWANPTEISTIPGLAGNWLIRADATAGGGCYANCDGSTTPPVANVGDFTCFLQKFAANDAYANCDGSTTPPVINVGDFTCFLQKFAAGCP